ncbi:MAG TPA: hypothetical protein VM557_02595 [Thermoanaerobaculia bacterium]|nr:hypothetical protein [Thermoanaerobaculia bacterium]
MKLSRLIQRAFDSTLANWPLLLIRIASSVAMTVVAVAAIIPVVALFVIAGVSASLTDFETSSAIIDWAISNVFLLLAIIAIITIAIAFAVAIHAFTTGGVAGIYLEADFAAPREQWTRKDLDRFKPDRWLRHGAATWWRIFLIYNITWGLFLLLLTLPLLLIVPLVLLMDSPETMAIIGCAGAVFGLMALIIGSIFVHVWTQIAVLQQVRRRAGVMAAIRSSFGTILGDPLRIGLLTGLLILISLALGAFAFGFQIIVDLGSTFSELPILFMPAQIILSLLQSLVSVVVGAWFLASLSTVVNESAAAEGIPSADRDPGPPFATSGD